MGGEEGGLRQRCKVVELALQAEGLVDPAVLVVVDIAGKGRGAGQQRDGKQSAQGLADGGHHDVLSLIAILIKFVRSCRKLPVAAAAGKHRSAKPAFIPSDTGRCWRAAWHASWSAGLKTRKPAMAVWVDADACPKVVRDILVRAAERTRVTTTFIANQRVALPAVPWLRSVQVSQGFDVADDEIVSRVAAGDLVVTQDIPLAADVIARGAVAVTPRGELLDGDNVRARLNIRDFMDTM